ncbi:MAG TPA: hypothetical protein VMS88_06805 [Terriglobales bacterium]|nr:hypothetical protein [Terriglobales bacterium]
MHLPRSLALALALLATGTVLALAARADAISPSSPDAAHETAAASVPAATIAKSAPSGATAAPPPARLLDLSAWLDYRSRNHLAALPLEARLFFQRGLLLAHSGNRDEAVRLVRGASELDPGFVAPHLTLASWFLLQKPSQTLLQYASAIEIGRQNFLLQLALAGNGLCLALQSCFLGLLAAGLIIVGLRNRELRHAWVERLRRAVRPASAPWWSWAFLLLPFVCGFGLALPTAVLLALLWPVLRVGERAVFVGLVATIAFAPWAADTLDRLAIPLREGQPPFYGVPVVATEVGSTDRSQEIATLARRIPDNPFLQFAAAWSARRRGDLAAAEAGYRRALVLWPDNAQVMTDLGNVLAMGGHSDEALELYVRAGAVDPTDAAAMFNASQIYTQRFDYRAATDALSRASALNFDLVKSYQSQARDDGVLPLVDEWIAPRAFWTALSRERGGGGERGALPPAWRSSIECSGWAFSLLTLIAVASALAAGRWTHRTMPLRACSNCGAVLCRRCACRRRENALCRECATAEARAETPDFGRVLLVQHRRRLRRPQRFARTLAAVLVPGLGLLAYRRAVLAVLLLVAGAALAAVGGGFATPFSYEARLAIPDQEVPIALLVGCWVVLYAVSLHGYFVQALRAEAQEAAQSAPVRSRIRLSDRDQSSLAA